MLNKIQIALYDTDGYMNRLVEYLCHKKRSMFETRLFTSLDLLKECVEGEKVDVLLAGEEAAQEIDCLKGSVSQIILLSESPINEQSECYRIFKYQSAQTVVKEVLEQIAEDDSICCMQKHTLKKAVELIGVYAPFGGSGVTEYALSMAKELAKHYRTLYVNLELFQGLEPILSGKKEQTEGEFYRGMSEVIFYLKQRKEKLALKLESIVVSVGELDYILAVEDYRDLYSLNREDIRQLLKALLQQTEYERVVFDIGYLGDAVLYLMGQCSQLYMPEAMTAMQRAKERAFYRFLVRENLEHMAKGFQRVGMSG